MSEIELLNSSNLPSGFVYPREFMRIVRLGMLQIEPWHILHGDELRELRGELVTRYSSLDIIPFAIRQDNDDTACWLAESNQEVVIVHDYTTDEHAIRSRYATFYDWFRKAMEDLIEFDT